MNDVCLKNSRASHLYHIQYSINSIIAAASPIISLLNRVHGIEKTTIEPDSWQEICSHELQICLDKCQKQGYDELIIASIITTWMNSTCVWPYYSEYKKLNSEDLTNLMANPEENLHILELIYILNRLGMPLDHNAPINELKVQELFYLIQNKRQESKSALEKQIKLDNLLAATNQHKNNNRNWHLFLTLSTTICLLGIWQIWQNLTTTLKTILFSNQVF